MEISEIEYLEMKNQIEQLRAKVDALGGNKSIREMVETLPYEYVKNTEDDAPIFSPVDNQGDAWAIFLKLAKLLHTQDYKFYMSCTPNYGESKPYIRSMGNHVVPARISQLDSGQVALSVQMLNELIPVYNKFFSKAHDAVLYKPNSASEFQAVKVDYQEVCE